MPITVAQAAAPQLEPVTLEGTDDMAQVDAEIAKSKLVADLQRQGREVRQAEDGIQYLAKISLITERFAVQSPPGMPQSFCHRNTPFVARAPAVGEIGEKWT